MMNGCCDVVNLSEDSEVEILDWRAPLSAKEDSSNFELLRSSAPHLVEFIETCLKFENSRGMYRVINRSLLPLYHGANPAYLKSIEFENIAKRSKRKVEISPKFKFSYIKSLCENLRRNKKKKRAHLVTLDTPVARSNHKSVGEGKRLKTDIIDLDDIDDEPPDNRIIDLADEKENETVEKPCNLLKDVQKTQSSLHLDQTIDTGNSISDKEEITADKNELTQHITTLEKLDRALDEENNGVHADNTLLVPISSSVQADNVANEIKKIENEIADLKNQIDYLDTLEVNCDTVQSPYILNELYKKRLVELYKKLCALTNTQAFKCHKVHLKVLDGHPDGPVRILENFLNNNIQSNGYPSFPDFNDVKLCVALANKIHDLNWDRQKITKEARALFTQCGRALQKLRQKREWKDLVAQVKREDFKDDPAEHDPELRAKLDANKETAIKNEMDIITRYAEMEKQRKPDSDVRPNTTEVTGNDDKAPESDNDSVILCEDENTDDFFKNLMAKNNIKLENINELEINEVEATNISGACKSEVTENSVTNNNEMENIEFTNITVKQEVKKEPDSSFFDEWTGNLTTTIVNIEDPFLIVEISSDSSDDEVVLL